MCFCFSLSLPLVWDESICRVFLDVMKMNDATMMQLNLNAHCLASLHCDVDTVKKRIFVNICLLSKIHMFGGWTFGLYLGFNILRVVLKLS